MSKTVPGIAADLSTPPRIGLDVVLRADSPSPLSRYAPNKSAKPPRMPRVVTTLRYVTTLGFMAYLTGMRVTDSSAWISSTKRAHLTLVPRTDAPHRRGIRILDSDTWHERCLPLEETLESTCSMGREERDGIDRGAGWSILRFMGGSRSGTFEGNGTKTRCVDTRDSRKRMQFDFSRVSRKTKVYFEERLKTWRV